MNSLFSALAAVTSILCQIAINGVGVIDGVFTTLLLAVGIANQQTQVYIVLILITTIIVAVIRIVGGVFSLVTTVFLMLLLLHRVAPTIGIVPAPVPPAVQPLSTTLQS